MTSPHSTSDFHLDECLNGIREKFNHLNQELDEARSQRDEYKRDYTNLAKELQELRRTVVAAASKGHVACEHCYSSRTTDDSPSPVVSSPTESYFSIDEENASLSLQSGATYNVEYNHDTMVALELNLMHTLTQTVAPTCAASLGMDGKYLATVSMAGIVQIFDMESGQRLSVMRDLYEDRDDKVPTYWCLGFSADGKFLATGQDNGDVKIWIVSQRRVRNKFKHRSNVQGLDFSPNGRSIAIASGVTVIIWRLRDGFLTFCNLADFNLSWSVRFSTDGQYIASGGIRIFNVRMGKLVAGRGLQYGIVKALDFTPDNKGLVTGSWNERVIHWEVSLPESTHDINTAFQKIRSTAPSSTIGMREISHFEGHEDSASSVSVSPGGHWIASGASDKTVRVWDTRTATLQCILHGHGPVMFVGFSRTGNYLAAVDGEGQSTVWNYRNLQST